MYSLCFHSVILNGPLPMYVAGSVHLSPPLVTSDSRAGMPVHSVAIEGKYGAGSRRGDWTFLSSRALTPSLSLAAARSAGVALVRSVVSQSSHPAMTYST